MASLYVESNEENFSYIINKNPASGMSAKRIKKGYMFGYFSNENRYNIVFFDGADEISFSDRIKQEFEYLDYTRYNSPLFVFSTLKAFFHSSINSPNEFDHPGKYLLKITSIKIKKFALFEKFKEYFNDSFSIQTERIPHEHDNEEYNKYYNNYTLTLSVENKTFYELINFTYVLSFFFIIMNRIEFDINLDIIRKVIKSANIIESPYYIKYLIKFFAIKRTEDFSKVKDELNKDNHHVLNIKPYSNFDARYADITNQLIGNKNIVDVGCGEGNYLKVAEKINNTYYAIDIDEEKRNIIKKKVDCYKLENVSILDSVESFFKQDADDYIVLMSEVIEHNELNNVTSMIKMFFNDENCKKIIITTPNKDFNQFYLLKDNETRYSDHKFEFTEQEAISYFTDIAKNTPFKLTIRHLGDEVDNIPTTLMIIFTAG